MFLSKKKKKYMDVPNPRTNGESKAIQTKSHPEAYTYTLTKQKLLTSSLIVKLQGIDTV